MKLPKAWQFFMSFDEYWDGSTRRVDTLQLSMIRGAGDVARLPDNPIQNVACETVIHLLIPVLQVIGKDEVAHGSLENLISTYEQAWDVEPSVSRSDALCKYTKNASKQYFNKRAIKDMLEAVVDLSLTFGINREMFERRLQEAQNNLDYFSD